MRRLPALALMVIGSVLAPRADALAQTPTAQPLVNAGDVQYLGTFTLPTNNTDQARNLSYGGHAMGMGPNGTLYIGGHDWYQRLCQVTIPDIGGTASLVGTCASVPGGLGSTGGTAKLGGSLLWNNRLIVSKYIYYDGDTSARLSHQVGTPERSNFSNPVRVGTLNPGFYGGYMAIIPPEWRSALGGPAITGQGLLSIVSRTSYGPSAFVFNPDDVDRVNPVPAAPLVYYPQSNPLANPDTQNELAGFADFLGGIAFPAGTRSVLVVGRHGMGPRCYGDGAACGDPTDGSKGYHYYPYRAQVWAYDANDLLSVRQGRLQPWQVRPYAVWALPGISNTSAAINRGGVAFDPATQKMYVTEAYGERPRVHVYKINLGSPSAPTPASEVCGDGIDNDADGQIDEGCASTPITPVACVVSGWSTWQSLGEWSSCSGGLRSRLEQRTRSILTAATNGGAACPSLQEQRTASEACSSGPIQPPSTPEVCGDGIDNDRDGQIDEFCTPEPQAVPGPPRNVRRTVNGTTVHVEWDAPITGGAATHYAVQAGQSPYWTQWTETSGSAQMFDVRNVAEGKYWLRIRAFNGAGASDASEEVAVTVGCTGVSSPPRSLEGTTNGSGVAFQWVDDDGCAGVAYDVSVGSAATASDVASAAVDETRLRAQAPIGTYFARVRTISPAGVSAASNEVKIVVGAADCRPPSFETRLDVQTFGAQVGFNWSPTDDSAALAADTLSPLGYVLEAGSQPGAADLGRFAMGRTMAFSTVAPAGRYFVRVRPVDACGLGRPSNEFVVQVP